MRAAAALAGVTAPINVLQFSEATRMRAGLGASPGKRMMPPFLVVAANEFRRARLTARIERRLSSLDSTQEALALQVVPDS